MVASRRHRGGAGDLLAFHPARRPWLIECKATTRGPFAGFPPADREALIAYSERNGLVAMLAWRTPEGEIRWVPKEGFPGAD